MKRLIIDNFITLKHVDIEIGGFTVLIGQQASGKSIIAKLCYFFTEFATESLFDGIKNNSRKNKVDKEIISNFVSLFDKETWQDKPFKITFRYDEYHGITIEKVKVKSSIKVTLLDCTNNFFTQGKKKFIRYQNHVPSDEYTSLSKMFHNFKYDELRYFQHCDTLFHFNSYIPASRAIFSTLSENIFSLLSETGRIDKMISEFGNVYSLAKDINNKKISRKILDRIEAYLSDEQQDVLKYVDEIIYSILHGEFRSINGDEYLETKEGILSLINTSSGQQESLPLLITVRMISYFWSDFPGNYYVEEPEAHLFPEAQYNVVKVLALLRSCYEDPPNYFITTHSPYVLTAINNLLYVGKIRELDNKTSDLEKDFNPYLGIDFKHLNAYSIIDGYSKSILDEESELIDATLIDSVSSVFSDEFDKLLDILYSEDEEGNE